MLPSAAMAGRRALVALLILVMGLAGAGRAAASAAPQGGFIAGPAVAGLDAPICHSGGAVPPDAPDPDAPPAHGDCCDACALLAPALMPSPPAVPLPGVAALGISPAVAATPAPVLARLRGPRQARAPPRG